MGKLFKLIAERNPFNMCSSFPFSTKQRGEACGGSSGSNYILPAKNESRYVLFKVFLHFSKRILQDIAYSATLLTN